MLVALTHKHYTEEHLQEVIEEMKVLGTPKIHAVWMEVYNHWVALEGCHRLRAAEILGLTPEIIEVEYSDELMMSDVIEDVYEDYPISYVCDSSWKTHVIDFE